MSNQAPWLCQYSSLLCFPRFYLHATYPEIYDAVRAFRIESSDWNTLSSDDKNWFTSISKRLKPFMRNIYEGHLINASLMPKKIYLTPSDEESRLIDKPMFRISTGIFVSNQSVYDVFCNHTLGQTHFSQVYIYDIMTEQKVCDTPYYFINVAERRQYLNIELSKGIQEYDFIDNYSQRQIYNPKDGDILLDSKSLLCDVDIWHEPILDYSLFFSDRLVQNLFEIGIKKEEFGLVQCGLV